VVPLGNEVNGKSLLRYSSLSPQEETARATYQRPISKATLAGMLVRQKATASSRSFAVVCDVFARAKRLRRVG